MRRTLPVELPEGYLEFYRELESWQNTELFRLRPLFLPDKENLPGLSANNQKPLLQQMQVEIDAGLCREAYGRFLNFLREARPEAASALNSLSAQADSLEIKQLIKPGLETDEEYAATYAESLGLDQELFLFAVDHILRPFLRVISELYQNELLDERHWWQFPHICPICGAQSHISRLKPQNGQRFMFCERCFSEWKVRYLACIYCGHDTPGDINCLEVDQDRTFRVYVCEKCKGYLKTYDERTAGLPTDMFIANIETVYLDMLARNHGYTTHDD